MQNLTSCLLVGLCSGALFAQNQPPNAPAITEPAAPNMVLNPSDVHMETSPFSDPDAADQHAATTMEIWTVNPPQRVWVGADLTGLEKLHAHLGDGVFENSHAGRNRLFAETQFELRVRHRDDSGDVATHWSAWTVKPFSTGAAGVKSPLLIDDVADLPAPEWTDMQGAPIELPTGSPNPMLRIETDSHWLLLRIDGDAAAGNRLTNPPALPVHRAARVVIDAGNSGANLVLPPSRIRAFEQGCEPFEIFLPAIDLPPFNKQVFWVGDQGATYLGTLAGQVPVFDDVAQSVEVPWAAAQPGFVVEIAATGFTMPVNIAFVPDPGTLPSDPLYYVTELYGTIKVVTNDGTVSTYASNLLNYTPSGSFPGSGEQGLAGVTVDPLTGDVFVGHLWRTGGSNYPRITRLTSTNGGLTSSSRQVILDMPGETQGQSHFISHLEIVGGELFCHMGDGFTASTALNLGSYRGKILRLNLDGTPIPSNPFFNGGAPDSRDYIWCYGVRNPFGGAWRAADGLRYCVENGPSIDRLTQLVGGRNFGWNNQNSSMTTFALYNWDPSSGPVNIEFVQSQVFGGSGFPATHHDVAFVTESGATYAEGVQEVGKRITQFAFDASGNVTSGPEPFVLYVGDGHATAVGLAAGPDGLYFSEFYNDADSTGPTQTGGRVLRVRYGDPDDCDANGLPDACEIALGAPDVNSNGVLDTCEGAPIGGQQATLMAGAQQVSVSTGGSVLFHLLAGPAAAGQAYQLLGSMTGTVPGTVVGGLTLPLNSQNDPWFVLTQMVFEPAILQDTVGVFDATGHAHATIYVPPVPFLLGLQLHHALLVTDAVTGAPLMVSNAVPLTLVP